MRHYKHVLHLEAAEDRSYEKRADPRGQIAYATQKGRLSLRDAEIVFDEVERCGNYSGVEVTKHATGPEASENPNANLQIT